MGIRNLRTQTPSFRFFKKSKGVVQHLREYACFKTIDVTKSKKHRGPQPRRNRRKIAVQTAWAGWLCIITHGGLPSCKMHCIICDSDIMHMFFGVWCIPGSAKSSFPAQSKVAFNMGNNKCSPATFMHQSNQLQEVQKRCCIPAAEQQRSRRCKDPRAPNCFSTSMGFVKLFFVTKTWAGCLEREIVRGCHRRPGHAHWGACNQVLHP
jgi:hypothetical protein